MTETLLLSLGCNPTIEVRTPIAPWQEENLGSSDPSPLPFTKENFNLLQERIKQLEAEKKISNTENTNLKVENHNLKIDKEKLSKTINQLKSDKASNRLDPKVFKNPKITKAVKRQIVSDVLKPYFSEASINWYLRKTEEGKHKRGRDWSTVDYTIALTIRRLSKKTFNYIRSKKLMPLPGMETIRKHYANFVIEEGHFTQVHTLLGLMALEMTEKQKIVVLSFDEVNTKADISLDVTHDRVVGPHSDMNVLMVRGLYGNYKVPIWAGYDEKMTKDILEEAIKALSEVGFHVIAVVCDMGTKNDQVKKELGVTIEQPWFQNPCADRPNARVFWYHCMPHLFKLMRNHFLDQGFVFGLTGTRVGKEHMEQLFEKIYADGNELTPAKKLSDQHINPPDRQKVHFATELFSQTTSDCIDQLFPTDSTMQELSQFVSDCNNFFDIFNASKEFHRNNPYGNAYGGKDTEAQDDFIQYFKEEITNLRARWGEDKKRVKTSRQPWQDGMIMCLNALKPMYEDLKNQYEGQIDYILTYRLNQDCLEQCFSILRAMGGNYSQFGALEGMRRLRNFILGAGGSLSIEQANIKPTEVSEFTVESVIDDELELKVDSDKCITLNLDVVEGQTDTEGNKLLEDLGACFDENLEVKNNVCFESSEEDLHESDIEEEIADLLGEFEADKDEVDKEQEVTLPQQMYFENVASELEEHFFEKWARDNKLKGMDITKDKLAKDLKRMEAEFQLFHKDSDDGLLRTKGITKNLVVKLRTIFPEYEEKLIKKFIVDRTFMKIRTIQQNLRVIHQEKLVKAKSMRAKRKAAEFAQTRDFVTKPEKSKKNQSTSESSDIDELIKKEARKSYRKRSKKLVHESDLNTSSDEEWMKPLWKEDETNTKEESKQETKKSKGKKTVNKRQAKKTVKIDQKETPSEASDKDKLSGKETRKSNRKRSKKLFHDEIPDTKEESKQETKKSAGKKTVNKRQIKKPVKRLKK